MRACLGRFSKDAAETAAARSETATAGFASLDMREPEPRIVSAPLEENETLAAPEPVRVPPPYFAPVRPSTQAPAAPIQAPAPPEQAWETRDIPGLGLRKHAKPQESPEEATLVPRGCFEPSMPSAMRPAGVRHLPAGARRRRLLIIDQHAARAAQCDALLSELEGYEYAVLHLAVPVVFEVAP